LNYFSIEKYHGPGVRSRGPRAAAVHGGLTTPGSQEFARAGASQHCKARLLTASWEKGRGGDEEPHQGLHMLVLRRGEASSGVERTAVVEIGVRRLGAKRGEDLAQNRTSGGRRCS
jgi:hypothetical protein